MHWQAADVLALCATIAGVLMALSPYLQIRRMRRTKSSNVLVSRSSL